MCFFQGPGWLPGPLGALPQLEAKLCLKSKGSWRFPMLLLTHRGGFWLTEVQGGKEGMVVETSHPFFFGVWVFYNTSPRVGLWVVVDFWGSSKKYLFQVMQIDLMCGNLFIESITCKAARVGCSKNISFVWALGNKPSQAQKPNSSDINPMRFLQKFILVARRQLY